MRLGASLAALLVIGTAGVSEAQVHKYYTPGTVWTVTTIRVMPGMDQAYLAYLDGSWKKEHDALLKAAVLKSYKVLKSLDDDGSWNVLLLREYTSLAAMEANEEKTDTISQQNSGNDAAQMQGYEDRSKIRVFMALKTMREVVLR
jgi:hypothetical protein